MNMVNRVITFDESLHRYTDEENLEYTSVTTLLGRYTPKFDSKYWSKYKADQLGISQKQVLDNWRKINKEACEKGTEKHKLIEDSVNSSIEKDKKLLSTARNNLGGYKFTNINIDILSNSELAKVYPEIFNYLRGLINQGYTIYVEKRTYSFEHLIAGTIDCLAVKGKEFIIVDWKTNKKVLNFEAGYFKKVNGIESTQWVKTNDRMLEPLNRLDHCKGVIYTLQLSIYAYVLELWGLKCIGLVLYHLRDNEKPKPYNIIYDRINVELLFIHHKNSLIINKRDSSNINFNNKLGLI